MKKLYTILCVMVLVCGLTAGQAFAIDYCKDINQTTNPGTNYQDEVTVDSGSVIVMDIQINDVPEGLGSGGVAWLYDPTMITVLDAEPFDSLDMYDNPPAPPLTIWDAGSSNWVTQQDASLVIPGYLFDFVTLGQLGDSVQPDPVTGDIAIVRITFQCQGPGDAVISFQTIPGTATIVGDTTNFDAQIVANEVTIHQVVPPCLCSVSGATTISADAIAEVTEQYTAAPNAECAVQDPTYMWSTDCTLASIDANTGLLTVPATTSGETCNVCAMDTVNTDDQGGPIPECCQEITIEAGVTCEIEIALGRECPGEEIDDPAYNRPGRRGLAATCGEIIDFTVCSDCDPFDPDCLVWDVQPDDLGMEVVQLDECCWRLTVGDFCDDLDKVREYEVTVSDTCNNGSDTVIIQVGKVIVDVQDATVDPQSGTVALDVDLINPLHHVRAVQTDIAECQDGDDNLVCTECVIDPDRALEFTCSANELADGSCRVLVYNTNPAALIEQGTGTIATVLFDTIDANNGTCACLMPTNIQISDQFNEDLCACQDPGEVCFKTCGDIYPQDCIGGPCGEGGVCGDGVVDLFDILEAIDIILGLQIPTLCQLSNGDVPNGMPPYCGSPPGAGPSDDGYCEGDGDVDIFDVLVMIDKALGKINCCDYCNFGQIF